MPSHTRTYTHTHVHTHVHTRAHACAPTHPHTHKAAPEPVEAQTEFTVKLVKYADDSKIKLIKEVKSLMEGMNLVQVRHIGQ